MNNYNSCTHADEDVHILVGSRAEFLGIGCIDEHCVGEAA